MKTNTITVTTPEGSSYDIVLTDSYDSLPASLAPIAAKKDKIGIVADDHTAPLYGQAVREKLAALGFEADILVLPSGEAHKTLESISLIYDFMVERHFTRKSLLISLGGGVLGDMTGFATATYMRGMSFVQLPTTLLSQVDASIGGKTGVDYKGFKNMVGAFHMPELVYINLSTLASLPEREIRSGMAEIIKAGLIRDRSLYLYLRENVMEIRSLDMEYLPKAVLSAIRMKQAVVEADPYEKADRMLLNYGHTVGHAVEKALNFTMTHGECVSLGMSAALMIGYLRGCLEEDEVVDTIDLLVSYGLPVRLPVGCPLTTEEILLNLKSDKKMMQGQIRFILLSAIGQAFVAEDVTDAELIEGISALLQ